METDPLSGSSLDIPYLSKDKTLQFVTSALVVLPVFLQAPWAHFNPLSACLFTLFIFSIGLFIGEFGGQKWFYIGSLCLGVSGSWLGGSLFWGWLREYPVLHIPVEAVALPLAVIGLSTKWRLGAVFYLACLFGTALTDVMMVFTGVMHEWPAVVQAPLNNAPEILNNAAQKLFNFKSVLILLISAISIGYLAYLLRKQAKKSSKESSSWFVASAVLTTTLWVDALFLITAFFQPQLSGLI